MPRDVAWTAALPSCRRGNRSEHVDTVLSGHGQHGLDGGRTSDGEGGNGAGELLHRRTRRVYHESHRVRVRFVAKGMWSASGERDHVTGLQALRHDLEAIRVAVTRASQ